MKVLRVINELRNGGVQLRLVRVACALVERGHDVAILCIQAEGPNAAAVRDAGVKVVCIPIERWWSLRQAWKLSRWIKAQRFDVVHSHNFRQNMLATMAARLAGVRAIFAQVHTMHTYGRKQWVRTDQVLSRFRSAMLAVSEAVAEDIRKSLAPFPPPRLQVLPNGVELERFRSVDGAEARTAILRETNWPTDAVMLLNMGRLSPQKNQAALIRAFARMHAAQPRARLFIAGEGELRPELEGLLGELGLSHAVAMPGQRDDIERLLAASDLFVLPSTYEGYSNAILEALASGLPVIATNVGGAAEQIIDQQTGLIVAPGDDGALAQAMQRLAADSTLRQQMAAAAREDSARFSHDVMIDRTIELYGAAISGRSSSQ